MTETSDTFGSRPENDGNRRNLTEAKTSTGNHPQSQRARVIAGVFFRALVLTPIVIGVLGLLTYPIIIGAFFIGSLAGALHFVVFFGPLAAAAVAFRLDHPLLLMPLGILANYLAYRYSLEFNFLFDHSHDKSRIEFFYHFGQYACLLYSFVFSQVFRALKPQDYWLIRNPERYIATMRIWP